MDVLKRVNKVIGEVCGAEEIHGAQKLKEELGLDSLSLVAVIVGMEEEFGVTFDDGDLDPAALVYVRDLISLAKKSI